MKEDTRLFFAIVQTVVGGVGAVFSTAIIASSITPWALLPVGFILLCAFGAIHLMDTKP